jgi:hypothetical protein
VLVPEPLNGREFADRLGVDAKRLRALIRKRALVPSHQLNDTYALNLDDQARIKADPAVVQLVKNSR